MPETFDFTISDHSYLNPMGYKRTLNHSMRDDAVKYLAWQQFVRARFFDRFKLSRVSGMSFLAPLEIPPEWCAQMNIFITWSNEVHADADNVWKGLADALFVNDKHLFGSFWYMHGAGQGGVEISISLTKGIDPPCPIHRK